MKNKAKNLLPKKVLDREALTQNFSKIKPRFLHRLKRLTNILSKVTFASCLLLYLMGYYPTFSFPPIKKAEVKAAIEISQEIVAASLPEPVNLPHPGYVSTYFSAYHKGVDIATGLVMPIHPIISGIVEEVNYSFWGYGNHVYINHSAGLRSMYAHMGRVYVKAGQDVKPSTIIGEVGLSGRTSGPHTHLEVTKNGAYIDPMSILPQIDSMPNSTYTGGAEVKKQTDLRKTLKPDFSTP